MASILVVEDDLDIAQGVAEYLEGKGYELDFAYTGKQALSLLQDNEYQLVLLDINLPFVNGYDICSSLIEQGLGPQLSRTPVIFMSSRSSEKDVLKGFQSGAWDYLVKPFSFSELAARIDVSLLKASALPQSKPELLSYKGYCLSSETMQISKGDTSLQLHQVGFDIINELIKQAPQVIKTQTIQKLLWGDEMPDSDPLRAHIYKLRKSLKQTFDDPIIVTVKGVGYQFIPEQEQ